MVATPGPVTFGVVEGLATRLTRRLSDDTFAGIHRLEWFDYSILIPYFVFLGVLAEFVVVVAGTKRKAG